MVNFRVWVEGLIADKGKMVKGIDASETRSNQSLILLFGDHIKANVKGKSLWFE